MANAWCVVREGIARHLEHVVHVLRRWNEDLLLQDRWFLAFIHLQPSSLNYSKSFGAMDVPFFWWTESKQRLRSGFLN